MKSFVKKHQTKLLITVVAILAIWITVLSTPLNGYLSLTGIYNLPMPEESKAPTIDPEKGYHLEEIRDGVYFVSSYSHNTMFVVADSSVIVVDALPSLGEKYLEAIREVTDKPVSHMIYSHSHDDHIGSADIFGDQVEIIAHKITTEKLLETKDLSRPVPTVTFYNDTTLVIGGKTIDLAYYGAAHNPGNIAIYLPKEKVLTMIDIAFPKWVPIHEFAIAEDIGAYYDVYDKLLAYDFTHFIGGHAVLGSYQDVVDQREYVHDIRQSAIEVYEKINITELGERSAKTPNVYATLDFGLNKMACECEKSVVDKWGGKLAGVDVFTKSHCFRMIFNEMTE